jgi:RNA polymerase sigma-70 factor (ECF subfamily)
VGRQPNPGIASAQRPDLYQSAVQDFGRILDRLSAGYEAHPDKRRDLLQEIHLQLWRSLAVYDERCSLKTWTLRVAHNTAASYVAREQRTGARLVSLDDMDLSAPPDSSQETVDRQRALDRLAKLVHELKPLDRQIMISYLEDLDANTIADITGLSPANVAMKIHRIKALLIRRFHGGQTNHHG